MLLYVVYAGMFNLKYFVAVTPLQGGLAVALDSSGEDFEFLL